MEVSWVAVISVQSHAVATGLVVVPSLVGLMISCLCLSLLWLVDLAHLIHCCCIIVQKTLLLECISSCSNLTLTQKIIDLAILSLIEITAKGSKS